MNDSSSSKVPGSNADLIIISPEELAKLGLLQDFSSIVSSPSSKKKHTKHNSSSTGRSSTTLEFSPASEKCESSARKRKHSRSSKNESFFKMPEASPTLKKSPVTSKLTSKPKISPEQHSPHSSKSIFLHRTPDDPLKKPVLKRNLENIKKIVSETIISRSGKKEVKVISNDAVSFSSKEINDLIRKAHVQKSDMQMEGRGFSGKKLEISDTSPTEESKESCSGIEISQGFLNQEGISIHVGTPCSEESEKTLNSLSFPNNSDISEVSCKKANEHSNVNDDIDQGESTEEVENKKVSSQDEELPSTPKFGLVNYSSNIPVAETSCIATNTLDPSELLDVSSEKSIEQSDSPEQNKISNLKFVQDKDSTKDFANVEQEQDLETDTKKRFSSPIKTVPSAIEETQCSDKNKKKLDRMFNKRRQFKKPQIVRRKNETEANQLAKNIPIPEIENQKNMLDPSVEMDEQGSSMISVSNESKDPEYSDDVNEEVKEVTMKSMSFPNELEKSNLEENDYLRIEEDTNSENTLLEKNLEASFNNTLQKRKPLLIEKKRDEARNQSTDSNQIADTSIISVHNPEVNAFSGSKEEQDSENIIRKGIAECASFSSEPEESFEITSGKNSNSAKSMADSAIKENITDTKEGDSLHSQNENVIFVKRRRRQVRQPLPVKMKKGEAVNHSSKNSSDVGTSTTDTLELNRNSNIPMNNVGCSVSEDQQDYPSISETENFAGNPRKESENATEKKTANELEESEEHNREAPKIWGRLEQKENATKTDPVENISNQNENLPCSVRESLARKPSLDQAVTECSTDIPVASSSGNSAYNVELRCFESLTKNNLDYSVSEERQQDSSSRDEFQKERKDCESLSNEREGSTENFPIEARQVKLIPYQNKNSLSRRRRSIKKPVLLKRSKDIAANHTPSYIPEKESLEIGAGPIEYSSSVLNEDAENASKKVCVDGKELRTETVTDLEIKSLEISEDLKKEEAPIEGGKIDRIQSENANLLHERRGHSQKPFVVNTKKDDMVNEIKMYKPTSETFNSTVLDKTKDISSNSVSVQGDNSSDNTTTQSGVIEDHSSEKSSLATESSLMNSVDHQDTISLPVDGVERKGRPRKKTFEGSPLKKSKDTIEIPKELLCQSEDVEKTAKKFDQSFSSDISFTTEHFSTPLKKRGRPKKKTIDEEADKAKSKRNYIETETIAEISSDIDSIANDTTVDNSLLSDTIECNDESMTENDVSVSEKKSSCSQTDTKEENNKTENEMETGSMYIVGKGSESIGQIVYDTTKHLVKTAKKRGRSKKTDELANVILESSISNPVKKSKRDRKPKKTDSQMNSDLDEEENMEINKIELSLGGEQNSLMNEEAKPVIVEKGNESIGQDISDADGPNKPVKKRGRPKKSDKLANVTLESSISNPVGKSKRGRKPKKPDFPEWELNEDNITEQRQTTEDQRQSFDTDHDFVLEKTCADSSSKKKLKTLYSQMYSELNEEENIEINKLESSLGGEKKSLMNEKAKAVVEKGNESIGQNISDAAGPNEPIKKRGRPKKSAKLANMSLESSISNPVGKSKRDRKPKKTDFPEWELNEDNIAEQRKTTEDQSQSSDTDHDLIPGKTCGDSTRKKKLKTLDSHMNSELNEEKNIEINNIESSLVDEQNSSINEKAIAVLEKGDAVLDKGNESNWRILSETTDLGKPVKKRGRSKSDKLANVTLESFISNPSSESKIGREPRKPDSSEWELNEDNIAEQRKTTEDQSQSFDTDHDLIPEKTCGDSSRKQKLKTLESQMNSELNEEENIEINKLESNLGEEQSSSKSEKAGPILEKSNESIGQDISGADGPTRPVKKRGRPRKSDLAANVNLEPTASYATGESRRGRKRKIIDYFELELNGSNFIEPRQRAEDQSQFSVTDHNLAPKKKARIVSRKKQRDTLDAHIISDLIEKEHIDTDDMTAEGNETERTTNVKSEDSTSGVEHFVSGTEDSEISEKGSTSSNSEGKMKNRKSAVKGTYIWNGQTTEMLNSVFSAAFGGEQSTSAASSSTSSQEPIKKGRRGRRKKFVDSDRDTKFSVDSTVSCCICSEVLLNRDWYVHNATKHYNLAWREGEVALNLDDDAAVKQKLKVLLPKNKILVCQNCSLPCEGVDHYIIHREECAGILVNGMVTCAVCNSPSDRENWLTHKLMHNNLAWRVGDPPLDLNDQPYVLSVLNAIYKLRKPLYCDKCGQTKKSVVGYLSHRAQCGVNLEDVKVECKQCGKKVLPVSMPTHVKMVHETSRETPNSSDYFDVDSNVTNRKRKAAKNALRIIDSFTKDTGNIKVSQPKPYVTNPNDFKEQEFVTPLLEKELEEHMTIKCKFHNCTFTADQIDTLIDHMNSCATKPGEFHVCTICFVIRSVEEKIRSHVTEVHDLFLPNSDDDEEEGFTSGEEHEKEAIARANKIKFDASKLQKDTNFKVKPYCVSRFSTKTKNSLFCSAFDFTWEFCSEHYSQPLLYDNLRQPINQWSVLQPELLKKYLPTAESSCDVARKMVRDIENVVGEEFEFKQYDLFEVVREDVHTTIFCAGPIYALAWAPTPHTSRTANQILAVAAGKDFESTYKVNSTYEEPCIIQFWDFGRLANRGPYPEPSLMLGLALDYGPVWHLEWCPSGCYDQVDSGRVGLLAVAGSIPTVSVYSIPMVTDDDRRLLIYKKKPLLKLQFVNNKNGTFEINMFPTRISWSKAPGHRYIAVGYTDGMVALFDLQTPGSFLKYRDDDGIVNILPYKLFQAHLHYISVLSLLHYGGGDRWLLTGSFDRDVHMHDLYNDTKETVHKRKIITDGTWLTNWLSYVVTSDESSSTNNLVHATLHAHRNYLFEPTTICSSQATLNSITSSDWLNGLIQVSALGEIFAVFPHQLMYSFDSVKNLHLNRFLTGYTKLIDKHKPADVRVAEDADKKRILTPFPRGKYEAEMDDSNRKVYHYFEPITYDGAERKYGLVFCDLKMDSFEDFSEAFQRKLTGRHEELDPSRPNLYSLQSANKVSSNPNYQASLYFATGYQAGFVRVSYLKFLENDPQVNKSV